MKIDLRKKKNIVFDLDGTLVESNDWHELAYLKTLQSVGFDKEFDYSKYRGQSTRVVFSDLFDDEEQIDFLIKKKQICYRNFLSQGKIQLKEGAMEILELLESQSYNIFLCTGGSRASVQRVLQTNGVCKFFQDSICGDDVENGKPDPTILNNLIERNFLEKEDTLLIEDSENGYKCGKAAGVDTLIVFREDDFECDLEFESLLGFYDYLAEFFSYKRSA